jgi:hypothetical protein
MFPVTIFGRMVGIVTMIAWLALFGNLTSVIGRALMSSLFGSSSIGEKDPSTVGPEVDAPLEQALLVLRTLGDASATDRAPMPSAVRGSGGGEWRPVPTRGTSGATTTKRAWGSPRPPQGLRNRDGD